ncbi:hypothetical protein [Sulfurimonas diazotrophicus]|uniref:DsrE family protein n=1 Tax=Sulfurimonas diazotrophicus TaxID=3131939 RepID=A0ABZ3HBC9_9BACT
MKNVSITRIIAALALTLFIPTVWADDEDDVVKIVYQCDFPDVQRVHLMLNTLNNAVKYYEKNLIQYEIDVVALGPCLQYFMKDFKGTGFAAKPYLERGGPTGEGTRKRFNGLKLLGGDNITFFACQNTMDKKNVKASQIADNVEITPGGIVKVIDDQRDGFAYIKIQ